MSCCVSTSEPIVRPPRTRGAAAFDQELFLNERFCRNPSALTLSGSVSSVSDRQARSERHMTTCKYIEAVEEDNSRNLLYVYCLYESLELMRLKKNIFI